MTSMRHKTDFVHIKRTRNRDEGSKAKNKNSKSVQHYSNGIFTELCLTPTALPLLLVPTASTTADCWLLTPLPAHALLCVTVHVWCTYPWTIQHTEAVATYVSSTSTLYPLPSVVRTNVPVSY